MTVIAEEKCWSVSRSGCGDGEVLLDPVLQPVPHVPTSLMSQPVPLGSLDSADEPSVSICAGSGDGDDVLPERQPVLLGSLVSGGGVLLNLGWQHVPLNGGLVSLLLVGVDLEDLGLILGLDLDGAVSSNLRLLAGLSQVIILCSSLSNLMSSFSFRLTPDESIRS